MITASWTTLCLSTCLTLLSTYLSKRNTVTNRQFGGVSLPLGLCFGLNGYLLLGLVEIGYLHRRAAHDFHYEQIGFVFSVTTLVTAFRKWLESHTAAHMLTVVTPILITLFYSVTLATF